MGWRMDSRRACRTHSVGPCARGPRRSLLADGQAPQEARKVVAQHDVFGIVVVAITPRVTKHERKVFLNVKPLKTGDFKVRAVAEVARNPGWPTASPEESGSAGFEKLIPVAVVVSIAAQEIIR